METAITRDQLIRVAEHYGYGWGSVEAALRAGWLPPAQRRGLGRGRGQAWEYPVGTERTARMVFCFKRAGYRGNELSFVLWWHGRIDWTVDVSDYTASVVASVPALIRTFTAEHTHVDFAVTADATNVDATDEHRADVYAAFDALASARRRGLDERMIAFSRYLSSEPEALAHQGTKLARVLIPSAFGVRPSSLGATAAFLERSLLHGLSMVLKDQQLAVASLANTFQHPDFWLQWEDTMRQSSGDAYRAALRVVRQNPELRGFQAALGNAMAATVANSSARQQQRVGPWKHSTVAARGVVLSWLMLIARAIKYGTST